jgi:hypothetical protein
MKKKKRSELGRKFYTCALAYLSLSLSDHFDKLVPPIFFMLVFQEPRKNQGISKLNVIKKFRHQVSNFFKIPWCGKLSRLGVDINSFGLMIKIKRKGHFFFFFFFTFLSLFSILFTHNILCQ